MKIRSKLILNYSILSIILLILFSVIVILSYVKYRQYNFNIRLHNRAESSANFLLNKNAIDSSMLRFIDRNIITTLDELQITIYNQNHNLIYTNLLPSQQIKYNISKTSDSTFKWLFDFGLRNISFDYSKNGQKYFIEASAVDSYGLNELKNQLYIIIYVLVFSLIIIIFFGFYNAIWSLKPFKKIINELEAIDPSLIKTRISQHGNDEISQLAMAFNNLLDRIEQAFESEKSFISNASHELRTPVTSILGQVEVALNKMRSEEEYMTILQSVYEDTTQMGTIINGFLDLAEANITFNQLLKNPVRIDELIFSVVEDFEKREPGYNIAVEFSSELENDTQLEYISNNRLLYLMFSNLIDNACKYSDDKKAIVKIKVMPSVIIVSIIDHGIGIPKEDLTNIFKPLFRSSNTSGKKGHGLGLAIVKRIADLHNISIDIKSELNIGTTVIVYIKKT